MYNSSTNANLLKSSRYAHNYSSISHGYTTPVESKLDYAKRRCRETIDQVRDFISIRDNVILIFSVAMLMVATASERVTFKMTVDFMIPYKFALVELIFAFSCLAFGLVTLQQLLFTNEISPQMREFPHKKIWNMAVIDTFQLLMLTFSAPGVSPTMTVILMHATTPSILLCSKYIFPDRQYGPVHKQGVTIISVAIAIALSRPIIFLLSDITNRTADLQSVSSLIYVLAAALQGYSTIYKEKCIIEWSLPINVYYLSTCLFFYQFLLTVLLSYIFLIGRSVLGFVPKADMFDVVYDGWTCFLGRDPYGREGVTDSHVNYGSCNMSFWFLVVYSISNLAVFVSVSNVIQSSYRLLGRAMAAAILVAFCVLWAYDWGTLDDDDSGSRADRLFGSSVGISDCISVIVLIVGMEVYGRDPEPNIEVITEFSQKKKIVIGAQVSQIQAQDMPGNKSSTSSNRNSADVGSSAQFMEMVKLNQNA